jgi:hypothetical protein
MNLANYPSLDTNDVGRGRNLGWSAVLEPGVREPGELARKF